MTSVHLVFAGLSLGLEVDLVIGELFHNVLAVTDKK